MRFKVSVTKIFISVILFSSLFMTSCLEEKQAGKKTTDSHIDTKAATPKVVDHEPVQEQTNDEEIKINEPVKGSEQTTQQPATAKTVPMTDNQKFEYIKDAAEKGKMSAQFDLGLVFEQGTYGKAKNLKTASVWYGKAAAQGHTGSRNKMAVMHYHGLGGHEKDPVKAKELFEQSVKENSSDAMFMLGRIYLDGAQGIDRDFQKGTDLIKQAAFRNNAYAMDELGVMYFNGTELIDRDRGLAYMWYKKSALKGHTPAMAHLGSMYFFGVEPVDKDEDKGIEWVEKAYKKGDQKAYDLLVEWGGGKEIEKEVTIELKKGGNIYKDSKGKIPEPKKE